MNKKAIIIALLVLMSMEAKAQTDSITVKNDSITWSKELEGVTVKAQRQFIKQEIDRIGYDVQADEESKTLTVLDLLRKVPMVAVDGEDNIKVKGNSNYKIYKNGHPDPSLTKNAKEILKSIPASMVKRIEVITDPGAREDAEGVDAILNIVMMDGRSFNGVTGGVNLSYSTLKAPSVSGNMTTQIGKAILSIDAGYNKMTEKSSTNIQDTERTYLTSGRTMKVHQEGSNPGHIFYADLGGSFDIDTLNLISASFGGYFYKLNVQGEGPLEMYDANKQILSEFTGNIEAVIDVHTPQALRKWIKFVSVRASEIGSKSSNASTSTNSDGQSEIVSKQDEFIEEIKSEVQETNWDDFDDEDGIVW